MSTIGLDSPSARRAGGWYYLTMSGVLAAIVVFGFSHTVPRDVAAPGLPPLLIGHAAVFLAWVLLLVVQPALVARGSVALHRTLGWAGAGLACAMTAMGSAAILLALRAGTAPPFYPHGLFLVRGFVGLGLFAGLAAAGVALRRRPDWHKRLMLCASIVVIGPGLERALPIPLLGPGWPMVADAITDLLALSGAGVDLAARRRVHPAYLWAIGALVLGQAAVGLLAASPLASLALGALGVS